MLISQVPFTPMEAGVTNIAITMTTRANLMGSLSSVPMPQMVQQFTKELLCLQARTVCPLKDTLTIYHLTSEVEAVLTWQDSK